MSALPQNAKYRPHLACGAKPGAAIERQIIVDSNVRFVRRYREVAQRRGWVVREVPA